MGTFETELRALQRDAHDGRDPSPSKAKCRVHTFVNDVCRHCGASEAES